MHFAQASTTLLYFSPWVIRPSLYCCSYSFAMTSYGSSATSFVLGIGNHHVVLAEGDTGPAGMAESKCHYHRSQKITVSF